jgi:hypothetical protein
VLCVAGADYRGEVCIPAAAAPGESYLTENVGVMTNPIGHPSRLGTDDLSIDSLQDLKQLMGCKPFPNHEYLLAKKDLFKVQRDFLKEQATRMDSLPLEGGSGRGLLS